MSLSLEGRKDIRVVGAMKRQAMDRSVDRNASDISISNKWYSVRYNKPLPAERTNAVRVEMPVAFRHAARKFQCGRSSFCFRKGSTKKATVMAHVRAAVAMGTVGEVTSHTSWDKIPVRVRWAI